MEERKNLGIVSQTPLKYHICDQGDFDSFYPISINNVVFAEELLQKRVMYCIDEGQDIVIRGTDEIDSIALNIDFTTCDRTLGGECAKKTLKDLQDYLGHPELIVMANQQRFDNTDWTHKSIVNEAVVWNQHIDKRQANWMLTFFNSMAVMDEIDYLDIGVVTPRLFSSYSLTSLGLSYSDEFTGYYKIAGFTVFRNLNYQVVTRSVYDVLNFLGDVGGLEGILIMFGGWFVSTISSFAGIGFFMSGTFYTHKLKNPYSDSSSDLPPDTKYGGVTKEGLILDNHYTPQQLEGLKT